MRTGLRKRCNGRSPRRSTEFRSPKGKSTGHWELATGERNQAMKTIRERTSRVVFAVMAMMGVAFLAAPNLANSQTTTAVSGAASFNPPPCDYKDQFYMDNGLAPTQVGGRLGSARPPGRPAAG